MSSKIVFGKCAPAWDFVVKMNAGDYVELMWNASSVDVAMPAFPAQSNPTRPSTPSVIISVIQI